MTASWEIKERQKVLCATIHTDHTSIAWAAGFKNLIIPGQFIFRTGMPYDHCRNSCVQEFLLGPWEHLFFLDSVPSYTPVLIKRGGLIECIPICDLVKFSGVDKEYVDTNGQNLEVYVGEDNGGWTSIKHVLRHPFDGDLYRINTHSGLVDVSANHSVMCAGRSNGSIAGRDIRVGMQLSMPVDRGEWGKKKRFFFGNEELAWFYGFFAAEGSASTNGHCVGVSNNKVELLERCRNVLKMFFGKDLAIHVCSISDRQVPTLEVSASGRRFHEFFRSRFYDSLGKKKVPVEILNAPENIKRNFLRGYYDGDGHSTIGKNGEWQQFSTNSQTLALGIQWLLQTTTKQTYTVLSYENDPGIVHVSINQENSKWPQKQKRGYVKKVNTIPYKGFLYDIETDRHVFAGGLGPILLHNSDVIPPPDCILRLLSHNLPIVSAMYCRRSPPHSVPVMMRNHQWITKFPMGSLVEVELVGAGALLVHRSVYEKVPPQRNGKNWFDWRVDMKGFIPDNLCLSEDYTWNAHVRNHGYKIYCDTSIRCKHIGLAQADYGTFLPAEIPAAA